MKGAAALLVAGLLLTGCASSKSSTSPGGDTVSTPPSTDSTLNGAVGPAVAFNGVTIVGALDLKHKPTVGSKGSGDPKTLETKDLLIGTGPQASPTSTVMVQYVGVLYTTGKQFDASWDDSGVATFPLSGVVPGFTQGIGGTAGVAGMKVGGRRIMILPSALGYGSGGTPDGSIPPNTPIVFVVDLIGVS